MKNWLTTRLRFALHRHGWPAPVGLLMALLVWPLAHWGADRARADASALSATLQEQRLQQVRQPGPPATPGQDLADLPSRLPAAEGALEALQTIHAAAARHGVKLSAGEYRLVREGGSPLIQRYQITLPASGAYPDVRAWMATVMNTLPTIAMDELSLTRQDVGSPAIETRVRWTLYLRAS